MGNLQSIVYLSEDEYNTLITNQTITKNGRTLTYNENSLYITPETGQDFYETIAKTVFTVPSSVSATPNAEGCINPTTGQNMSGTQYYRTGYRQFTNNMLFKLNHDDYKYTIWLYSNNNTESKICSLTNQDWATGLTLIPNDKGGTYIRIGYTRKDGAALTTTDVETITANAFLFEATDTSLSIAGAAADAKAVGDAIGGELADLNSAIEPLFDITEVLTNKAPTGGNNTAVTYNNDGSTTIGTTDYGNTLFGDLLTLAPGDYYLFGIPNGIAFLSPSTAGSTSYSNRVFENASSKPKRYHTDVSINLMVCFRSPAKPAEAYTIHPSLFQLVPKVDRALLETSDLAGEVTDLKNAFGVNLAGTSIGYLYPVHILSGSKITVSTSNGSTFDQTVKLHYWGQNKNRIGQWAFGSSYGNSRTITVNTDIYWLSFEWQDASTFGVETGETMPTPYMVNRGSSAKTYQAWFENPDVRALSLAVDAQITDYNQYRNDKANGFISLNANYFNANTATWNNGIVATATGSITQTEDYEYAFCPLYGEGIYITQINDSQYGTNARKMALYDAGKRFIKSIDASSYNGDNQKYTLSSADAKTAVYTIIQRKKNSSTIPKLFFDPIWDSPFSFPVGPTLPLPPVYGVITDPLYKKTVVCDGDSICAAALDNPYQWQGWFGRIMRGYQTSGKNFAVGGGTIMDRTDETVGGNPRHCIALDIDTIHSEYPNLDYLILEGGTNDADLTGAFSGDTPPERFGTWDKDSMSADYCAALDTTTFCGAVEYLFWKAITYYPNAKIGFIVAMKMGIYTNQKTNRKRYFDEIIEIAKKWGIPVLNLWDSVHAVANFDAYYDRTKTAAENVAAGKFYNDGQHPTSYGYNLMQPMIEAWMKTL